MFLLCSKPTQEVLAEYTHKVDFLKGLLETEKLVSLSLSSICVHTHTLIFSECI